MNIYVGNLPYKISDDELRGLFAEYGEVVSVSLVKDKMTGQSKGFGFVEMANANEATNAINGLNEQSFGGRNIKVNEAKPRPERPRREGGGGGGMGMGRSDGGARPPRERSGSDRDFRGSSSERPRRREF